MEISLLEGGLDMMDFKFDTLLRVMVYITCNPNLLDDVWEPLNGEGWPLERMSNHDIIKKWGVLLPYLVLFVDLLLHLL
jgi:hypothetical protein